MLRISNIIAISNSDIVIMDTLKHLDIFVPESSKPFLPVEISNKNLSLRGCFVERNLFEHLPTAWRSTCGFYILLSYADEKGEYEAYVGKATNGFYNRLRDHDTKKAWWKNALLVHRTSGEGGFDSTQASYLEGRMHDALKGASNIHVQNIAATGDKTLHSSDKDPLEQVIASALDMLMVRGYRVLPKTQSVSIPQYDENVYVDSHHGAGDYFRYQEEEPFEPTESQQTAFERPIQAVSPIHATAPLHEVKKPPRKNQLSKEDLSEAEMEFYEVLAQWRSNKAKEEGKRAFFVFENATLARIAKHKPLNKEDLLTISGVGNSKAAAYGDDLLYLVHNNRIL